MHSVVHVAKIKKTYRTYLSFLITTAHRFSFPYSFVSQRWRHRTSMASISDLETCTPHVQRCIWCAHHSMLKFIIWQMISCTFPSELFSSHQNLVRMTHSTWAYDLWTECRKFHLIFICANIGSVLHLFLLNHINDNLCGQIWNICI